LGNPTNSTPWRSIPTNTERLQKSKGIPISSLLSGTIGELSHIKDKPEIIQEILAEIYYWFQDYEIVKQSRPELISLGKGRLLY